MSYSKYIVPGGKSLPTSNLCPEIAPHGGTRQEPYFTVSEWFPFDIQEHHSLSFVDESKCHDSMFEAQWHQSLKWIEYGKSPKRVQKHKDKIEKWKKDMPHEFI